MGFGHEPRALGFFQITHITFFLKTLELKPWATMASMLVLVLVELLLSHWLCFLASSVPAKGLSDTTWWHSQVSTHLGQWEGKNVGERGRFSLLFLPPAGHPEYSLSLLSKHTCQ